MVVNGAVVGMIASLAGAAIGFLLWLAYVPSLQASAGHRVDALNRHGLRRGDRDASSPPPGA